MHDLNEALDDLRSAIPYAHGSSVRKLSKISTLLLARNHIIMQVSATTCYRQSTLLQSNAIDELQKMVRVLKARIETLQSEGSSSS